MNTQNSNQNMWHDIFNSPQSLPRFNLICQQPLDSCTVGHEVAEMIGQILKIWNFESQSLTILAV